MATPGQQLIPHLSVVAVTRNDDHGGDLRGRTQHFVDGFIAQCRRHRLAAELILVEWNPPTDRPPLEESLLWPADFGPVSVRIVTVPPEVHSEYPHSASLPLFQMIGKNVGIRRARGRYVLATNIDILFDDELVRYMRDKLEPGAILRVDRYDVPSDLPKGVPFKQVLAYSANRFFQVNTRFGTFDRESRHFLGMGEGLEERLLAFYFNIKIFGVADELKQAGQRARDFILAGASSIARAMANRAEALVAGLMTVVPTVVVLVLSATAFVYRRFLKIWPLNTMPSRLYWVVRRNLRRGVSLVHRILRFATARLQSVIAKLRKAITKAWRLVGSFGRLLSRSSAVHRLENSRWLHTNACGDFTLLARDDWFRLRGYPDWPIFSWHLDSVLMYAAHAQGLREIALGPAFRSYHIDHSVGSGWSLAGHNQLFARLDAKAITYLSSEELHRWQLKFAEDPKSAIINDINWGLGDRVLLERRILPPRDTASVQLSSVNV